MYVAIGSFNTLNTSIISQILAFLIQDHISTYLAFIISLSISYILNAKVNFKHRLLFSEYIKFISAYVPHFLIYATISTIALSFWNFPPFWATVVASISGAPVTYLIMRFFAFKNKK